jgi:hypothetical protein
VAHNYLYVDQLSWKPLALSVCEFGQRPMSSSAIAGLEAISGYLPKTADQDFISVPPLDRWADWLVGHYAGPVMCSVTLVIWWTTLLRELYDIIDMTKAVGMLPHGSTAISRTEKGHKLVAVSIPRRCLMGAFLLMRAIICVSLFVCGTLWLAHTISLSDLILNAAALEIVLTMDELMFSVFAPITARRLIESLEPLPMGRRTTCLGLDAKPAAALSLTTVGLVYIYLAFLSPQIEMMESAREALCGGNLNFVAGVDQTGLVFASDYSETDATSTYSYQAMRRLVEDPEAASDGEYVQGWMTVAYPGISGSHWSVVSQMRRNVEEATVSMNPYCQDMDSPDMTFWDDAWRVAQMLFQDLSTGTISSCEDVALYCSDQDELGVRARQHCPETCGCHDPTSSPQYLSAALGCPVSCRFGDVYQEKLGDLECADYNASKPQTISGTDVISVYKFLDYQRPAFNDYLYGGLDLTSILSESGCPALVSLLRSYTVGDLCREENAEGVIPLTLLCPETCRCDQTGELLCPPACGLD